MIDAYSLEQPAILVGLDSTADSWKEYLVEGRSYRIAVKVRHESATVTCGPICNRPCGRDAGSYAGVTVCPTSEWIAVGVDYRDEEGKESDSED